MASRVVLFCHNFFSYQLLFLIIYFPYTYI